MDQWGKRWLGSCGERTKLIEECRELRHAQLDRLGEVALLPVEVHRLPTGRVRVAGFPCLFEHIAAPSIKGCWAVPNTSTA